MDKSSIKIKFFLIFLVVLFIVGAYLFVPAFINIQQEVQDQETQQNFEIDQILMKVLIKSNESLSRSLRIINTGENTLHLTVRPSSSLDYIVTVSEVYSTLTPGQTKVLQLDFNSKIA